MNMTAILYAVLVFLGVILLLVVILLVAKKYLVASGDVKVTINGDKEYNIPSGGTLLASLGMLLLRLDGENLKEFAKE